MKNRLAEVSKTLAAINGCQFASLTYKTKKTKELARYTVEIGFSYHRAVEKSVTELEILTAENSETWSPLQKEAASALMASLKETLLAHSEGRQNRAYTKAGQYIPIRNGLNVNTTDNTIQLFGLLHSKVVLQEGAPNRVNSSPFTIAKNKIRRQLSVSKFREFALDVGNIQTVRANGEVIEIDPVMLLWNGCLVYPN